MKNLIPQAIFGLILVFLAMIAIGCSALLTKTTPSDSLPVQIGAATTNDCPAVAYEKLALALNAQYNTGATEPLFASAGAVLLTLTSAFAGWYARHHTANQQIAAALAVTAQPQAKT
jgi:hypothetical protein